MSAVLSTLSLHGIDACSGAHFVQLSVTVILSTQKFVVFLILFEVPSHL